MISNAKIVEAVDRLVESAEPLLIFLFGSYARGEANKRSDLDFLVIKTGSEESPRWREPEIILL